MESSSRCLPLNNSRSTGHAPNIREYAEKLERQMRDECGAKIHHQVQKFVSFYENQPTPSRPADRAFMRSIFEPLTKSVAEIQAAQMDSSSKIKALETLLTNAIAENNRKWEEQTRRLEAKIDSLEATNSLAENNKMWEERTRSLETKIDSLTNYIHQKLGKPKRNEPNALNSSKRVLENVPTLNNPNVGEEEAKRRRLIPNVRASKRSCCFCRQMHRPTLCPTEMSIEQRLHIVETESWCTMCLAHKTLNGNLCRGPLPTCAKCGEHHATIICVYD